MRQLRNSVQQLLRETRWRTGLTQQELAERSGLSIRTISDIERGHVLYPRAATLRMLACALGMGETQTADFLLVARAAEILGRQA
jgi:transcriptional regulator with XRE-family HTH domain